MENKIIEKKILLVVVVYDRIGNFIKWCKLAKKIKQENPLALLEISIVHNCNDLSISDSWKSISKNYPVNYLRRDNVGLDIGVLQDVKEKRILDDFDFLIWFTDDCFPTSMDFLSEFLNPFMLNEKVGLSCFEVSKQIRPHARTTGFCLKKETLEKVVFPVPKILTKQNCYDFEHGQHNFYLQIRKLGLEVKEIEKDIFYNEDSIKTKAYGIEKSQREFNEFLFGNQNPPVKIFSTAYARYPQIISSVFCQNYKNIDLEIWHDGKIKDSLKAFFNSYSLLYPEFSFKEVGESAKGNYGHHLKKEFLETFDDSLSEYILITNEDNYISPYMISKAVELLEKFPEKIGAYCGGMVHNYKPDETNQNLSWRQRKNTLVDGHIVDGYGVIPCRIERGFIDISSILFRSSVAKVIPWKDFSHSSDWDYIESIEKAFGGKDKFIPFPGIHLVHN